MPNPRSLRWILSVIVEDTGLVLVLVGTWITGLGLACARLAARIRWNESKPPR